MAIQATHHVNSTLGWRTDKELCAKFSSEQSEAMHCTATDTALEQLNLWLKHSVGLPLSKPT